MLPTVRPLFFTLVILWPGLLAGQTSQVDAPQQEKASTFDLQVEQVQLGFDGRYKVGHWTPVRIAVQGDGKDRAARVTLTAADGAGVRVTYRSDQVVSIPAGQTTHFWRYVKFGRLQPSLQVTLYDAGPSPGAAGESPGEPVLLARRDFTPAELPPAAISTAELVVTFGDSIGLDARTRSRQSSAPQVAPQIDDPAALPDRWYGYEAVDVFVLTTSRSGLIEQLDTQQLEALRRWVSLGGRLLLSVGRRGNELLGPSGPLAAFAPGQLVEVVSQRNTSGLEMYAEATERLSGQTAATASIPLAVLRPTRGRVELSEDVAGSKRPMLIRAPLGFGQTMFVAFDLDQPPLAEWQGRSRLTSKLLQSLTGNKPVRREERSGRVAHEGYDDLAGQLRSALDQFNQVTLVPFSAVAALLIVYILLIGPGDYYLLKKLRRMQWSWVTFPAVVLGFSILAYVLVNRTRGERVLVNQVDIIDVDAANSLVRGTMWANVYSPFTATYDLRTSPPELRASAADRDQPEGALLSWQGLPGTGLGGLDATRTVALRSEGYTILTETPAAESNAAIKGMPIQVSATKSIGSSWWQTATLPDSSQLSVEANGLLEGTVTNPLPASLDDVMLLYENWAYVLNGELPAGGTRSVDSFSRKVLDWRLTGRRLVETTEISTPPWNPSDTDVARILELMMFHDAAGGQAYTQLSHRFQGSLDLSSHLWTGQAVLVGRAAGGGSQLQRDGQSMDELYENRWTFYRVLLPVQQGSAQRDQNAGLDQEIR